MIGEIKLTIWKMYRYEDSVLAPKMVKTEEGVFVETQPVSSVSADSKADIVELLKDSLQADPEDASKEDLNYEIDVKDAQPVLLQVLGIKKWKDFEKRALMYTLHRSDNQLVMRVTGRGADGMWSIADSESRNFSFENSLQQICECIADEMIARRAVRAPLLLGGSSMVVRPDTTPEPKKEE